MVKPDSLLHETTGKQSFNIWDTQLENLCESEVGGQAWMLQSAVPAAGGVLVFVGINGVVNNPKPTFGFIVMGTGVACIAFRNQIAEYVARRVIGCQASGVLKNIADGAAEMQNKVVAADKLICPEFGLQSQASSENPEAIPVQGNVTCYGKKGQTHEEVVVGFRKKFQEDIKKMKEEGGPDPGAAMLYRAKDHFFNESPIMHVLNPGRWGEAWN